MHTLTYDSGRQLVHVVFEGHFDKTEAIQCVKEIEALLQQVEPGFCLIADFGKLEKMDYACSKEVQMMMDHFRLAGVRRIVRVNLDPKKDIGLNIMSIIHYGHAVEIRTVETLEEALADIEAFSMDKSGYKPDAWLSRRTDEG